MKASFHLFFVISIFLIACKDKVERPAPILQNNNNVSSVANPLNDRTNKSNTDPLSPDVIATKRAQALAILNFRLKKDADFYTLMEDGVWELQFVHQGEMSKPGEFDGFWYDFKKDHTYEYGTRANVEGSGKYNYHFERGELLMVDNLGNKKPEEWTVKSSGDVMILVGTATYNDNHIQKKLVNHPVSFRS